MHLQIYNFFRHMLTKNRKYRITQNLQTLFFVENFSVTDINLITECSRTIFVVFCLTYRLGNTNKAKYYLWLHGTA